MTRRSRTTTKQQPGAGLGVFPVTKPVSSGKRRKPAQSQDYPDRHFMRVMDAGFPPHFVSQMALTSQEQAAIKRGQAGAAASENSGWKAQGGTVQMRGTPKQLKPGWMGAREQDETEGRAAA